MNINTILSDSRGNGHSCDARPRKQRTSRLSRGMATLGAGLVCVLIGAVSGYFLRSHWTIEVQPVTSQSFAAESLAGEQERDHSVPADETASSGFDDSGGEASDALSPDDAALAEALVGTDAAVEAEHEPLAESPEENGGPDSALSASPESDDPEVVPEEGLAYPGTEDENDIGAGTAIDATEILPGTDATPTEDAADSDDYTIPVPSPGPDPDSIELTTNGQEVPQPKEADTNGEQSSPIDEVDTNGIEETQDSEDDELSLDEEAASEGEADVQPLNLRISAPCGAIGMLTWTLMLMGLCRMRRMLF